MSRGVGTIALGRERSTKCLPLTPHTPTLLMSKVNRDLFYKLASELSEERVQAAVNIIKELSALELPAGNDEWKYVLNRLIKGLSSDRNGARLGFSLCLTEVVNLAVESKTAPECLPDIAHFIDLLSSTLSLESDNAGKKRKGKEERGLLFGKLFGLQCLLNEPLYSNVFLDNGKSVSEFSLVFMQQLLELSQYKNWIREPCLYTLFETITKLIPVADNKFIVSVLQLIDEANLTLTNDGLAIYLSLLYGENKVDLSNVTLKNKAWKENDPLARGNLPLLTEVLCQSTSSSAAEDDGNSVTQANWSPRLHFLWKILLPIICRSNQSKDTGHVSKKRKKEKEYIKFPEFWQMAVDESFFKDKSSSERKYLGFVIFEETIRIVPEQWAPHIFSRNLMRTLINQTADAKRMLHKISQKTLNTIVDVCQKDGNAKLVPCLKAILFGANGSINFDKLTKSKTTSKLISTKDLDESVIESLIRMLTSEIPEGEDLDMSKARFVFDTLLHITRSHRTAMNIKFAPELLEPIIIKAFFTQNNEQLNELAKERLFSILAELNNTTTDENSWQYYALDIIIKLENDDSNSFELVNKLDDSLLQSRQDAMEVLEDIQNTKQDRDDKPVLCGIESLLSMCLLQLYSGDVDSISVLEELCGFYNSETEEGKPSMVGITEILLSLLAQKRAMLRKVSLSVWELFVSEIGADELNVLLGVLSARENKQGFSQLFEGADDLEIIEDEEDDENGEDKEEEDKDDGEEEDSSSDASENGSDDSMNSDNEDVANIDKETSSALAKALNLPENIINENGEVKFDELSDFSGDDDESDEESMDDEKMMELDDQLSEIFKRRKEALSSIPTGNQRKNDVKMSRENVISFKHRIIDMLEIYVKHIEKNAILKRKGTIESDVDGSNLLLFIQPMLKCVKETLDKPLSDKVSKLLKGKVFKIDLASFSTLDNEQLLTTLKTVHNDLLISKAGHFSGNYYSLCSTSSIFIGKILLENNKDENSDILNKLIDTYSETTKAWMAKGKFGANVFIDFFNWLASKK